jgi:predicted alpha/beta superfamily hydrolase
MMAGRHRLPLLAALFALGIAAPASAQAPTPIVIGQSWRLHAAALGTERTINVWLPPSYAAGNRRYPVLYVLDGGLAQDFQHISGLAQLGALSWLTQDFIVVGVETVDRRRELAFPVERDAELRRQYPTAGASAVFRRYLIDEVKPFVAARYRISGEDALLGESLAGLFIVETYLRQPDAFATYIAMDPSLWWDNGRLSEDAAGLLARHGAAQHRLWLSVGRETLEQPAATERLLAALRARPATALELRYEPRPNLSHATIYHPTAWEALQALYPRPPA